MEVKDLIKKYNLQAIEKDGKWNKIIKKWEVTKK